MLVSDDLAVRLWPRGGPSSEREGIEKVEGLEDSLESSLEAMGQLWTDSNENC